ncbi:MAG: hypothetical protein AAB851_00385 [Patescibacteria group bacterium]
MKKKRKKISRNDSAKNKVPDRLEISIVNGKMTIQDYSQGHDSEKLIELLKVMGIKSKIESDGPCG